MKQIVLASRNEAKLAEMQALLAPLGFELKPISDFVDDTVEETAPSFVENALLKARHAAQVSGLPAVADDSGLEVEALQGLPGVLSARYAKPGASDSDNNQKLLRELKGVPEGKRGARFISVMVFLRHAEDSTPFIAQGTWRGVILSNPRGNSGFGYDPLFFVPDLGHSAAELDAATKNKVSHRAKAARQLYSLLHDAGIHA
jgi:XTP/dITP diphosphohydrolase